MREADLKPYSLFSHIN